jgi:hypothetical protein
MDLIHGRLENDPLLVQIRFDRFPGPLAMCQQFRVMIGQSECSGIEIA